MNDSQDQSVETAVSNVSQLIVGSHGVSDDSHIDDLDLDTMEQGTAQLLSEGVFTPQQAEENLQAIEKARRTFRDLSPAEKKNIITKRVHSGQEMMQSTLGGNTAVIHDLKLHHGILKNRFSQFVPFTDRALVNMEIFGEEYFGKANNNERMKALSAATKEFYEAAKEARLTAQKLVEEARNKFDAEGELHFSPQVPVPGLETKIHIHSKVSMYHLRAYLEFDELLTLCAWLEWNGCRSTKEVNAVTSPLFKMALALGRRGYLTFTDLMRLRREKSRSPQAVTEQAA